MLNECVILLHGFGRSISSLKKIDTHLQEQGYVTIPINYPSRHHPLKEIILKYILPKINKATAGFNKVHFVAYSMGGLITRYILAHHRPSRLGRVVFIAVPNHGTNIINILGNQQWFKTIFGPAVQEVMVGSEFINALPQEVDYETGVISGNLTVNPFTSLFMLEGEDDGTVTVESTKIAGMKDHIVIRSTHNLLLYDNSVIEEVEHFITNGKFAHTK